MKMNITRSQIKAIGKRLRQIDPNSRLDGADIKILNQWRKHHSPTLHYYGDLLQSEALKLGLSPDQFTITQRLKRVYSMILKLKRFPDMQLSTMDDIAGARIVLPTNREVALLADALKNKISKNKIKKVTNYIARPKEDGYRSLHVIYEANRSPSIQIEIQIRSLLQHYWATGVEIFGTLEKTSFKTGEGGRLWNIFFQLLSSRFAAKEGTPTLEIHEKLSLSKLNSLLIDTIRELNIIEQLNAYSSAHTSDWRKHRPKGRGGNYALVTLDNKKNHTDVAIYAENQLANALHAYSSAEKDYHSSDEKNIVLINMSKMDKLEKAYPNYFMDTNALCQHLAKIVLGTF